MRDTDRSAVRALHLFADMAVENFDAVVRGSFLQAFPAGVELLRQADTADFLHVLLEGSVELLAATAGRETTIAVVRPVASFILAAVLRDRPYLMSARTLARARVLMIPGQNVRAIFAADPAFALAVTDELAGAFRFMVRELKNHKLRTGAERLANWLLLSADAEGHGATGVREARAGRPAGHDAGEPLARLQHAGPYGVDVSGRQVRLARPDELRRLARPDPLIDQM